MLSYELSEEQEIVRSTMQDLSRDVLAPKARAHDVEGIGDDILQAMWESGIVQSQADDEDHSALSNALIFEELAAGDANVAMVVGSACGFVRAIVDQGSEMQRQTLLGSLDDKTFKTGTIAAMEPGFAGDVSRPSTTAKKSGDDYVINGRKTMVPNATNSSHFLVLAELDGATDVFIVDRSTSGVTVEETDTLGLRGLGLAEVDFKDVKIPANMRLGESNGADVQRILNSARVGLAAAMLGVSRAVYEHIIPYTKERVVHGTPLAQKQKIAFDIADMKMETDAMRWMIWKAAWAFDNDVDATKLAQLAYTYASERVMQIADNGLQSMGGHGFVEEHPMEMWYRNARSLSVLDAAAGI